MLFSQIRDQLLRVKRQAAIDQAQAGVVYAQSQVAGIATGDAASVRVHPRPHRQPAAQPAGAAGDFDVVMAYRTGDVERPPTAAATSSGRCPADLRADVDNGGQSYKYAPMPDDERSPSRRC